LLLLKDGRQNEGSSALSTRVNRRGGVLCRLPTVPHPAKFYLIWIKARS